jgi:hypothetical protein
LLGALWLVLGACGADLVSGTYRFDVQEELLQTCPGLPPPPATLEGDLEVRSDTFLLSSFEPYLQQPVGGRTLLGRFFNRRDDVLRFIPDTSFRTVFLLDGLQCPAFYQLHLEGRVGEGETDSFLGTFNLGFDMERGAPAACPRSCAVLFSFHATKQ